MKVTWEGKVEKEKTGKLKETPECSPGRRIHDQKI